MNPNRFSILRILNPLASAAVALTLFAGCGSSAPASDTKSAPPDAGTARSRIGVAFVNDLTGGQAQGAFDERSAAQLLGLLKIAGVETVELRYFLVQEKIADPISVSLPGFQFELPAPPSENLPYDKFMAVSAAFVAAVKEQRAARTAWEEATTASLQNFARATAAAQVALAERWAEELRKRGMRDFRRSSVADAILAAASTLPATGTQSWLVVASDGQDAPPNRPSRKNPFTEVELPPHIHLIFLNADGAAQRAALFKGLRNSGKAVPDLAGAVACIVEAVTTPESNPALVAK